MAKATVHKCPECDWTGKTKGSLTQHMNKAHEADEAAKLRAQFGDIAPRPGGAWKPDRPLRAAPSGVPSIDYAIGIGGVPRGCLVEIFGPPRAGKTFTALTFSAFAQQNGGRVGFVDAERALQPTFLELIPGLNVDQMEYAQPHNGEQAMEISKQFLKTGLYDVWTLDSLHACIPQSAIDAEIGSPSQRASLAQLASVALPVIEHVIADTNAVMILINHIKTKPGVTYGRDWYTPGGSAPEYYSAVRLNVWASGTYKDKKTKKQIGHRVKVKVEKSKVSAPFSTAEYDLFYQEGETDDGRTVVPGIDLGSNWLSVLQEEGRLAKTTSGNIIDTDSGEQLGAEREVIEALEDPRNDLVLAAQKIVYPEQYR